MKILKFYIALAAVALLPLTLTAQVPTDYYNDAQSKNGATLKTALHNKIKGHTVRSYGDLWTDFQSTDKRTDGKVWDMYSTCDFTFVTQQCGSYSNIGDCYNREHSFPKSWFNDASPMYTDLFHLYPTDGKTNGMRSNYPFGEVGATTWSGNNGSKLGDATANLGYTGRVFEPDNEYKGDFARSYFYMVTRYEDVLTSWSTPHLDGTAYPAFSTWTTTMLLKWHRQDPVSEKEQNRNNAVFQIQNNRNPFIDHPELVEYVWGDSLTLNLKWGEVSNNPTPNDPTTPEEPCSVTTFDTVTVNIFDTIRTTVFDTAPTTLFEDFETMTGSGAYTGAELTLGTGAWFTKGYTTMDDNDRRNGERSVRLRGRGEDVEHRIQMEFDKSNGIGTVTFSYGSYRTHSGGQVKVQVSTDQGATWRDCGEIITAPAWSGNMQTATVEVHQKGNARIRILKLSTAGSSSVNIDDISITDYCACSKVITFDTISVFDTVTVNVFDTISVKIFDTVTVNVFDTISVFDTVTVKIFDTVMVNVFDTATIKVFDTVRVTVYDTVQVSPNPTATVKVKQGSFSVYPNPAVNGQLTVDNEQWKEGEAVEIYSMSGALTAAYKTTGRKTSISISALPNGAYLLRVGSYTAKVVKQ